MPRSSPCASSRRHWISTRIMLPAVRSVATWPTSTKSAPAALSCSTGPSAGSWLLICRVSAASPSPGAPCTPLKNTRAGRFARLEGSLCRRAASMRLSSEAILGAAAWATRCSVGGAPSAQAALGTAVPCEAPWSSPDGFCTVNTGTTSVPCVSALVTRRQSPSRGGSATAGTSCACKAAASASARLELAASGSSAAVGAGTASRAGGGCASRRAVAPGLPWNGCGRSPQPASSGSSRSSALKSEGTASQGGQQGQHDQHPDIGHGEGPKARLRRTCLHHTTTPGGFTAISFRARRKNMRRRRAYSRRGGHRTIAEIWCPIGPPSLRVRRRWLKNRAGSVSVSSPSHAACATPAARRRERQ